MKYIGITDDAYDWFQKTRKFKKGKRIVKYSENELILRMLNMWEAGNLAKNPDKIFPHENGKFYRSQQISDL